MPPLFLQERPANAPAQSADSRLRRELLRRATASWALIVSLSNRNAMIVYLEIDALIIGQHPRIVFHLVRSRLRRTPTSPFFNRANEIK